VLATNSARAKNQPVGLASLSTHPRATVLRLKIFGKLANKKNKKIGERQRVVAPARLNMLGFPALEQLYVEATERPH
jgi:hypothetical protein